MNEQSCDINNVICAASDLVALGSTVGSTSFYDGIIQIQFSSLVSQYVNEVINDVNNGVISAWEGVKELREEYASLSSKALFYAQNGVGVVAVAMQIEIGVAVTGASSGLAAPLGALFFAHGFNNIYEGGVNIYNGPEAPTTQGPVRRGYQYLLKDEYKGNMAYGTLDLILSAGGMIRHVRKTESVQFFRKDPINYEFAYQQSSRLALFFEALIDSITIHSMYSETASTSESVAQ